MRHALVVLVIVGCGDPPVDSRIDVFPGRVTTVKQGGMLQIALRAGAADPMAFDLAIDDATAGLFDTHSIAPIATGAIVTLVPSCAPLANAASNGVVAMTVGAPGFPRETLTVDIVADPDGVCPGAPEHVVTSAVLAVATVPDLSTVLCTKASILQHSLAESREIVRIFGANDVTASDGQLLCGDSAVRLEVWPPIDAPASDPVSIETLACNTASCGSMTATECCNAHPDLVASLTVTKLDVPTASVAEIDKTVLAETFACADLNGDGTTELVLANNLTNKMVTTQVNVADRWTSRLDTSRYVSGLLGFAWQSGSQATDVEYAILGGVSGKIARAHFDGASSVTWDTNDPRLQFIANGAPPDAFLPVPIEPGGAARYIAHIETLNDPADTSHVKLACISDSCNPTHTIQDIVITRTGSTPSGFGLADFDGDGQEDFIVAYQPDTLSFGGKSIAVVGYQMDWGSETSLGKQEFTSTLDVPAYGVSITGVRSETNKACESIYLLSHGVSSSAILELTSDCHGAPFTSQPRPIVNNIHAIANIDQHLIAATALGIFKLSYVHNEATGFEDAVWRLEDPLLEENALVTGDTLSDPATSRYAEEFVPCFGGGTKSFAFETQRGGFEWTQLDVPVRTFSAGSSP